MHQYCVPHRLLSLVGSFLSGRVQRVIACDHKTRWRGVSSGVPQGSVLGPSLFALYINDVFDLNLGDCSIIGYADDLTFLFYNRGDSTLHLQDRLIDIERWSVSKRLFINVGKTKLLTIHRTSESPKVDLHLNGVAVENVKSLKLLGVVFQHDLRWTEQMRIMWSRINRAYSMCRRVKMSGGSPSTVMATFFGLVFSIFAFCWPVICDVGACDMKRIIRLGKNVSRLVGMEIGLVDRLDAICRRLCWCIASHHEVHPLAVHFQVRQIKERRLRKNTVLIPFPLKHSFYLNSFVKFYSRI